MNLEEIVDCMLLNENDKEIQRTQTEHRIKLVDFWRVKKGDRVFGGWLWARRYDSRTCECSWC